ncbi:MAG TPA: hypothetical protein VIM51_05425 [Desulfosporosinus sp.]
MDNENEQKRIRISLDLDPEALRRLDKVCKRLKTKRPSVIQMFLGSDIQTVDYIMDVFKRIDTEGS